uniref:DUF19 domain-containing protein n=1 Tax=Rhabditophanes sp. KR3021 TaxID=114890 RepID=A0AC35TI35_9BILA
MKLVAGVNSLPNTPCYDRIQKCGLEIQDLERQIVETKNKAFKKCVRKLTCLQERAIFEDCYSRSIKAVRADYSNYETIDPLFTDISDKYKLQTESCFASNPFLDLFKSHNEEYVQDEDAIYARIIFSTEFDDKLWGLPEASYSRLYLEAYGSCLIKEFPIRIFGGGVSRIVDSSSPLINNATTSCLLTIEEVSCYKNTLSHDRVFQQMIHDREATLRVCIRSVRLQSECRSSDGSRMRGCVCSSRETFEELLSTNLLECVRKSDMSNVYRLLSNNRQPQGLNYPLRDSSAYDNNNQRGMQPITSNPYTQHQFSSSRQINTENNQAPFITQGSLINGQCLCACNGSPRPSTNSNSNYNQNLYTPTTNSENVYQRQNNGWNSPQLSHSLRSGRIYK